MKAVITIFLSILILLLSGCAGLAGTPAATSIPSDTQIYLERGPCFGACPVYTITIDNDGKVVYQGKEFVETIGEAKSTISEADLARLLNAFEGAKFSEFEAAYNASTENLCVTFATDMPSVVIALKKDGTTKTVNHYLGCQGFPREQELIALEDLMDEVVNTEQWIK
jgi:hypothetical protein